VVCGLFRRPRNTPGIWFFYAWLGGLLGASAGGAGCGVWTQGMQACSAPSRLFLGPDPHCVELSWSTEEGADGRKQKEWIHRALVPTAAVCRPASSSGQRVLSSCFFLYRRRARSALLENQQPWVRWLSEATLNGSRHLCQGVVVCFVAAQSFAHRRCAESRRYCSHIVHGLSDAVGSTGHCRVGMRVVSEVIRWYLATSGYWEMDASPIMR
jgi:hypothetical protein